MRGILYGVGVGPGDPELMTLKAVRLIKENDIISVRGLGRVIYNRQISVTKKGKNLVSVSIYC